MRILVIPNSYPTQKIPHGGIFILNRVRYLRKNGFDCRFVIPYYEESFALRSLRNFMKKPDFVPSFRDADQRDIFVTLIAIKRGILDLFRVRLFDDYQDAVEAATNAILSSVRVDEFSIIHGHGGFRELPSIEIAARLAKSVGKPYVVTLHGNDVNFFMAKRAEKYLAVFQNAAAVIFVSRGLFEKAKTFGYSGKNAYVVPNGYDAEIFWEMDKKEVRKELGIFEANLKYVGFVGDLSYVKGADRLPRIFKRVTEQFPQVKFIIVGDGKLRKAIEKQLRGLNYLITGFVEPQRVAKYMNAMDVMVLPSRYEGFGIVCLEAQACGTCVIGSAVGGIPEAIGFEEYLVNPGPEESLISDFSGRIVEILTNGYDASKLLSRAHSFAWRRIIRDEISIYESILSKNSTFH